MAHELTPKAGKPYLTPPEGTKMQASSKLSIWLFLVAFALVFYGVGASFVESFVNYPTWRLIGANEFRAYHQTLGPLVIGYMVIPLDHSHHIDSSSPVV